MRRADSLCVCSQELEGANLDVAMAQHLLVAADRFQLSRLRRICERRLCETVEVRSTQQRHPLYKRQPLQIFVTAEPANVFLLGDLHCLMPSQGYSLTITWTDVNTTQGSQGSDVRSATDIVQCAQVESVATTLSLAEQNHAEELKRVCLEFVSRNLQAVMLSEGYQHMVNSCPQLQVSLSYPSKPLMPNSTAASVPCQPSALNGAKGVCKGKAWHELS